MKNHLLCCKPRHLYGMLILFLSMSAVVSAQHQVTGVVTDAETGESLLGVNIILMGTQTGTTTDNNGEYFFQAPDGDGVLIFSYLGYLTREEPIDGRQVINVALEADYVLGDELVVVGYGVQRRRDVTGSIGRVDGERISRIPTQSVDQALQGVTSGIQVTPSSGAPGASAIIRIRGVGTLNDASPLFVVDGMTMDNINFLNPHDIESVDVLKDASATAIYGSRGANGVILITTRRSRIERPAEININYYYGWQQVARTVPVTNAFEYATLANEAAVNENRTLPFDDPSAFGEGTDWQSEIFRVAPIQNLSIRASGGTERTAYTISGSMSTQDGIIHENYLDRYSFRLNNDYYVSDYLQLGHNIALVHEQYQNAPGVVGSAYRGDPTIPVFTEDGNYSPTDARASIGNPVASLEYESNNENTRNRVVGNAFANITFLDHFMFRTNLGIDADRTYSRTYSPIFFVSAIQASEQTSLNVGTNFAYNILWENTLQFQREIRNHRIDILTGFTMEEFRSEGLGGGRINVAGEDPSLWFLNASDATSGVTNFHSAFDWAMLSFLGRVNYTYFNRYLATVSLRRDGSSRFGVENRYGWFPSFALGWIISDEPFMRDMYWLDNLKFRGSWGQTGNDKIDAYPGRATVAGNLNAVFGPDGTIYFGALPINLANPQIRWEETTQYNFGMETSFLNNRLSAELEYYDRTTDGILVRVPIPGYIGTEGSPFVNAAEVKNYGFEANINWQDNPGGFYYRLGANFTTINNEVLSLGRGNEDIFSGGVGVGGQLSTRTVVGRPIGSFFGYKTDGIFQNADEIAAGPLRGGEQPGDLRFVDVTGDGQITEADRIHLGSPIPDYLFSFNMEFGFRGFDLSAVFTGQAGNQIYDAKRQARFGTPNFERSALNRWTGEGTSTTHPRITDGGHNYLVSDFFLADGDFLKLQNLTLGYTFGGRITQQLRLNTLRLYMSGTNLFTLTGYDGYTPEVASGSVIATGIDSAFYPFARTFNVGVSASF